MPPPVPGTVVGASAQVGPGGDTGSTAITPVADATQNGLLRQISGNTTDFVDGSNHCQNLVGAVQPTIWSARLRSFNAIGNSTFEVDQRNAGAILTNPATNVFLQDRYQLQKNGTMTVNAGQNAEFILLPGTNFTISRCFQRITLTAQQLSLAAGDLLYITQWIEGPNFRELINDVHSVSLLVRTSVAGLKFGFSTGDAVTATVTLTKLCTIPNAAVWTLIPLPNLPVFPAGNFSTGPGLVNQFLRITLAAGSSFMSPANDTWQNGAFGGAVGQDNFASKPVNSTFDIAFIQHEPGPLCTTLIDKPFVLNYDECLRYYCKSTEYATLPTAANNYAGCAVFSSAGCTARADAGIYFPKPMAKAPTVTLYDPSTGTVNQVYNMSVGGVYASATAGYISNRGFLRAVASGIPTNISIAAHYTADTGW
jgi:hypothetical protein